MKLLSRDPMDCSPPGSSVYGIFQARVLEWDAIAFSHYRVKLPLITKYIVTLKNTSQYTLGTDKYWLIPLI